MGIFSSDTPASPPPPPPVPPAAHPATMASGEVQKAAAGAKQRAAAVGAMSGTKSTVGGTGDVPNAKAKLLGDTA